MENFERKDPKEITRVQALQRFGLTRLPKKLAEGEVYAWAVVLCLKTDGREYYCVQGTDTLGNLVIKQDFEEHGIVEVLSVYPISRTKAELNKKPLEKATRADKVKWLGMCKVTYVPKAEALEGMTDEELDALCIRAIRSREDLFLKTDGAKEKKEE